MIIAIRFFCAGQAEISLKAEGNNPQPCLNRCRGIRHEGFSSELSVTEALQIIYIISVSLPSQDRGSFYDLVICCHSNIFRKGNKRGKKKNLLKDFMDIFPVYIITRLSSFW